MMFRHAWRSIARMPVVASVVVVSLGVGIGVNTAVFSWVQALILQPLPGVRDAGRYYSVDPRAETGTYPGMSWIEYGDLRDRLRAMPDLIAFRMAPFNVGERGSVQRALGLLVSGNYFEALGLEPALGRFIRPDEVARPGDAPVVVISYDYWLSHFGGRPVLDRSIRVNDRLLTIVGVAPPAFQGTTLGLSVEMWAPATLAPVLLAGSNELTDRGLRGYSALGRLADGATLALARQEVDRAMAELAAAHPDSNRHLEAEVLEFWNAPRGPQRMLAQAVLLLQGVMLLLLLAVCGNTANLMLARASARQHEIGVRLALGAGPWRIARALLAESLLLSFAGAALGVLIAAWGTDALRAVPFIGAFPIKFQTGVDLGGLAFATGLATACALLFGITPAVQLARTEPLAALRTGERRAGRGALRNALMAVEVGLAVMVLLAAGLFFESFQEARGTDPGFRREGVLLAAYDLAGRNLDAAATREFTARLLERLRTVPGVDAAAISSSVPLDIHGLPMRTVSVEGRARDDGAADRALTNTVTPGYFGTIGIPLRRGSDLADLRDASAPPQAIVNEEFVRRFIGSGEAIGRRVESSGRSYTIAGVVADSVNESFGEAPAPVIYLAYRDRLVPRGEMHVRTRPGAEMLLAPAVERIVRDLDPSLPVFDVRTLGDHIERNLFLRRIPARMFVVLGPALLVLAAIGIYGVVAYSVSQRTREIGVRLALGATPNRVVAGIVGDSMKIVAVGALGGCVPALALALHLVRGASYMSVFGAIPAILLAVAAGASWLPARRAAAREPLEALRGD